MRILTFLFLMLLFLGFKNPEWGFHGHKKINRKAVFTLPQELLIFYKKNIEYITEHAVDPDKRRYALKNEFSRHYIDIDHWDDFPFDNLPRLLSEAILKFGNIYCVDTEGDSLFYSITKDKELFFDEMIHDERFSLQIEIEYKDLAGYVQSSEKKLFEGEYQCYYNNELIKYGILPYFLEDFYKRLVYAFENKDLKAILKISADIGHYIGDAHVPLHTTVNYNGQLTNQDGIHAFWESRLPELYDKNYDFLVGKAQYIDNKRTYIWNIILESHYLLDEVLRLEKTLRHSFSEDEQLCFDKRLDQSIWTECPEFAEAYHNALDGMVEKRMRDAVNAIGSFWYSAWVDAGQPNLLLFDNLVVKESIQTKEEDLNTAFQKGAIHGRKH